MLSGLDNNLLPWSVLYDGAGALHPDLRLVNVHRVRGRVEDPVEGEGGRGVAHHFTAHTGFLKP